MDFGQEGEVEAHTLKEQLVPNFHLLDHNVQKEIVTLLELLLTRPDKKALQDFSRMGLLEEAPLLRSHLWKRPDPNTWKATCITNYELYRSLVDKFIGGCVDEEDLLGLGRGFDPALWGEIQLDTRRTHSALNFFQKEVDHTRIYLSRRSRNSDILSRILYIWGRINPTVRYVQGMNEILAPLYYLQFQRPGKYCQSQVFFLFSALMTALMDLHIKDMDQAQQGVMGRMRTLNRYLKVVDFQLWSKLESEKVLPHYYSFRWLSLLLAQQFGLYETMKLWDWLLAYDGYKRFFFLYCCCIAILKYRKAAIMGQQFINILPLIQRLRDVDLNRVIEIAVKLYEKYSRVNIEKLYMKMNEEIVYRQQRQQKEIKAKTPKWNYSDVLKNTGNFFSRLVPSKK